MHRWQAEVPRRQRSLKPASPTHPTPAPACQGLFETVSHLMPAESLRATASFYFSLIFAFAKKKNHKNVSSLSPSTVIRARKQCWLVGPTSPCWVVGQGGFQGQIYSQKGHKGISPGCLGHEPQLFAAGLSSWWSFLNEPHYL